MTLVLQSMWYITNTQPWFMLLYQRSAYYVKWNYVAELVDLTSSKSFRRSSVRLKKSHWATSFSVMSGFVEGRAICNLPSDRFVFVWALEMSSALGLRFQLKIGKLLIFLTFCCYWFAVIDEKAKAWHFSRLYQRDHCFCQASWTWSSYLLAGVRFLH